MTDDYKPIGTVVAVQANYYGVRLDPQPESHLLLCTRRTRLKKIGQKVMVGDRVVVEEIDLEQAQGVISEVLPRNTVLERPPVANGDQILLVFAIEEPSLEAWQLSRFLVKAESTGLEMCLCLNKTDLVTPILRQQWQETLEKWGYEPVWVSVSGADGIGELLSRLRDKITIMAGLSGVGKSSLLNYLLGSAKQRTGEVSGKLQKGRHTTRHVELFQLPGGGLLADTPGFNQPDLDCEPSQLAYCFPEARKMLESRSCQFNDCLHRDEPNCVVRGDWERYEHYLEFLDEVIALQETLQDSKDQQSTLKLKSRSSGQSGYEPKLESKKYRRYSRREKHQSQEKYENLSLRDISEETEEY
ncbi:MAG: Small ribosomal subunit biogenesis GTPase RsgA [Chroococcopsis gigantea SAG 12.99]|nr:Small ribosomal subunit biogenesis GTPase RsgA [Chroococcopsis gigantea SAG 12.99]